MSSPNNTIVLNLYQLLSISIFNDVCGYTEINLSVYNSISIYPV